MAGPHQPSGLPDADLPHQKYMYVCMYVCMYRVHLNSEFTAYIQAYMCLYTAYIYGP